MPKRAHGSSSATASDPDAAGNPWEQLAATHSALEGLDAALGRIRRLWDQPVVRQWYQARLDLDEVDATMYRTLRAIRQAASSDPSVNGVADVLRIDASTASRFIERAVAAGYARRSPSPADRRRSSLVLTDAGIDRLLALRDVRVEFLSGLTEGWPADDIRALTELLLRLDDAVTGLEVVDGG